MTEFSSLRKIKGCTNENYIYSILKNLSEANYCHRVTNNVPSTNLVIMNNLLNFLYIGKSVVGTSNWLSQEIIKLNLEGCHSKLLKLIIVFSASCTSIECCTFFNIWYHFSYFSWNNQWKSKVSSNTKEKRRYYREVYTI